MSRARARAQALALLTLRGVDPERREVYARVLARRSGGLRVAIAGAEVCQSCGAIEPFAGLAAARLTHRKGDYLCSSCLRELSGQSAGPYGAEELARINEEMSRRPRRLCEVCTGQISASAACRVGPRALVCADCEGELRGLGRELETVLSDLSRLRYLELRQPTLEELFESGSAQRSTAAAGSHPLRDGVSPGDPRTPASGSEYGSPKRRSPLAPQSN
jgi:hypothetical protein